MHDHDHEHDHEHAEESHDARVTVAELTPVRRRLDVEIPAAEVQAELDRAFSQLGTRARLPGFRPGRAPRAILDRMFGAEVRFVPSEDPMDRRRRDRLRVKAFQIVSDASRPEVVVLAQVENLADDIGRRGPG